jgi:hypothetical protein
LDVRIDKLKVTEEEMKEYTRELEILRDRIYQVKRQVDTMSLGSYGISEQLEKIIGNTIQTSAIMRKYYMVLNDAAKEYETTENKIIEKYTGIHKNKDGEKEKKEKKMAKKKKSFWENAGDSIGGFFVGVGKGFGNFAKGVAYDVESFVHDPSDYVDRTKKQVVLGNFTEETTVMGTIIQIGAGVAGVDLPADLRDLSADVMNWEWSKSHIKQTLLDGISVFPIAGGFKSGDEVADIVKNGSKTADKMDEVKDVGEKVVKGGSNSIDYFVGPNGKALPRQYENWIGTNIQEELLSQAENPQLKNAIKQLYRGKSFIGDGGTADVIKFEHETGIMLGKNGGSHVQKGIDMASYIENKILTQNLSETDRALATELLDDLNNALGR